MKIENVKTQQTQESPVTEAESSQTQDAPTTEKVKAQPSAPEDERQEPAAEAESSQTQDAPTTEKVKAQPSAPEDERQEPAAEAESRTDWKNESRKWEKYAKEANKKVSELQAQLDELNANAERARQVTEAAKAHGVNPELLSRMAGDIEENAAFLASMPKYPSISDSARGADAPRGITEEDILKEKDPIKRVNMRAQLAAEKRK